MERKVELSARLKALGEMVTPGNIACDVGCDHGYLSIWLVQQGICPRVIAMDVREGPLLRAKSHIREWNLESYIEPRLSDGVTALAPGEAQSLICAGMGGRLMERILTEGEEKCRQLQELILQPQSEIRQFRQFLRREGYRIVAENMIEEEGKYYPMMRALPVGECVSAKDSGKNSGEEASEAGSGNRIDAELSEWFGGLLLAQKSPVLYRYLLERRGLVEQLMAKTLAGKSSSAAMRREELAAELTVIRRALSFYRECSVL